MNYRNLGSTGVKVSPLCLGAMMFGAWGNPDHDDGVRIIHRALDAGINFIDTADVYSRGESEEIVGKALAGGRRDNVVLATKVHGTMGDDPNQFGNSRRWIVREVENSLRRLRHRLDRPLPDPPPRARHRHRRDARRADRPRPRRQGPLHRLLDVPGQPDRRGAVGRRSGAAASASSASSRRTRCSSAGIENDVLPTCQRYGMGVIPWSPLAGGWLQRPLPARARTCRARTAPSGSRPLRHVAARQPAQARGRRRAGQARRGGRDHADRDGARVRDPPSGGDRGDHRAAHDGAARVPARRRRRRRCPTRCSTGSTRSSRPDVNVNPADGGWPNPALEPAARRR